MRGASGSEQLHAVARGLRVAGLPARGLNRAMRRNITAAMTPMKKQVQANALAIPTKGKATTGLRQALVRATRISILTGARNAGVRLIVDGKKMPQGQQALPQLMEGERRWRHKLFGDPDHWYPQESHPFVAPAIPATVARVSVGVLAAIDETANQLAKGTP